MKSLIELASNAKIIIGTISIIIASLIGAYTVITEHFVTTAYAKELENNFQQAIESLQQQTSQNKILIIEMKLVDYERKIQEDKTLTPTEKRQYERLLLEYNEFNKIK